MYDMRLVVHMNPVGNYISLMTAIVLLSACSVQQVAQQSSERGPGQEPADQFYMSRMYPDSIFPMQAYRQALLIAANDREAAMAATRGGGADWIEEGPYNISGRFNTIAIHPDNTDIILAGLASGGIFKTIDGGTNWYPVFDAFSYLAIAHIVYDPVDPNTVYAATGDPNISGFPFIGDGLYKSTDGGESWFYTGLGETGILTKIIVHPTDNNIIYAGAMGIPFERNPDRGLYKSTDAGISWEKILYIDDDCGVIDIVSHPTDPDKIYAAVWNRIRNNHESMVSGDDAGIYRSVDGGDTWTELSGGLPTGSQSRISLEMNPDSPTTLYASYVGTGLNLDGIYKTTNSGNAWSALPLSASVEGSMGGFGWYFDGIQINPFNTSQLFVLGVGMYGTTNDGSSWSSVGGSTHADKHAMAFISDDTYWLATDGGLYYTFNNTTSWNDGEDINSAQFYHIDQNPHETGIYWGGMQDNGTSKGSELTGSSWEDIYGADGFHSEFRTDMDDVFYVEYQNGGIIGFDGSDFFDATAGIDGSDRRNWNTPYLISRFDNDVLYAGTYRMYKSESGMYPEFEAISGDLTDGLIFASSFHTITTIEEDFFDADVLYAGTVDANVYRTLNGGSSWDNVSAGLPVHYVTDLVASRTTANRIFVSHSGYKEYDYLPHIHRSDDNGSSWTDISGDLPPLAINALCVHPDNDDIIFVATDGGVYTTINGGTDWERLGASMPVMAIYDMEYDAANEKILAGTYARGLWTIEVEIDLPPVVAISGETAVCLGDTLTLTASGAETYTWTADGVGVPCTGDCASISVSPVTDITYEVTGYLATGLSATNSMDVTVLPVPEIPYTIGTLGDWAYIENPVAGLNYQWYDNDGPIPGATNDTLWIAYGSYVYVVATNQEGCSAIGEETGWMHSLQDVQLAISLYPNPVHDWLVIDHLRVDNHLTILVQNALGAEVWRQEISGSAEIDVRSWPNGVYFIRIEGESGSETFVKE
jgi:photosystem II stability/assembly factor-like uncharacterized protein